GPRVEIRGQGQGQSRRQHFPGGCVGLAQGEGGARQENGYHIALQQSPDPLSRHHEQVIRAGGVQFRRKLCSPRLCNPSACLPSLKPSSCAFWRIRRPCPTEKTPFSVNTSTYSATPCSLTAGSTVSSRNSTKPS